MKKLGAVMVVAACGSVAPSVNPDAAAGSSDAPRDVAIPVTPSAVMATATDPFAVPSATFTKVPYKVVAYDVLDEFDPARSQFTASHAGDFQICATIASGIGLDFEIDVFLNGVREKAIAYGHEARQNCRVLRLAKSDVVDVRAYQNSGAMRTFPGDGLWGTLTIHEQHARLAVRDAAAFTAAAGVFTHVPYSGVDFDEHAELDAGRQVMTASEAGDYRLCASLAFGNSTTAGELDIFKNGARERGLSYGRGAASGCRVVRLAKGDVIDIQLHHEATAAVTIPRDRFWSWWTAQLATAEVSLANTPTFAVPSGSFAKVPYTAVLFDDHTVFDAAANQVTAPSTGDYELCASIHAGSRGFPFELDTFVDGTRDRAFAYGELVASGCRVLRLPAGVHVDVRMYQASGAAITVSPNGDWNWMTLRKL